MWNPKIGTADTSLLMVDHDSSRIRTRPIAEWTTVRRTESRLENKTEREKRTAVDFTTCGLRTMDEAVFWRLLLGNPCAIEFLEQEDCLVTEKTEPQPGSLTTECDNGPCPTF
jgi:hypothetical protein